MKRIVALLAALAGLFLWATSGAEKIITLTFAGDCTLGTEEATRKNPDSFDSVIGKNGYGYCFANFRDIFSRDDCTVVNCECVLSDSADGEVTSKSFRFRGAEDYVNILKEGSVEAVSLANNHTHDYSEQGLANTKRVLDEAGIGWAWDESLYVLEKDGIRIAFASVDYGIFQRSNYLIRDKLLKLREDGEINAVVMLIHEGVEYFPKHMAKQELYGEYFITTAGADLVIMHHSHVLQGIRILDNRSIFYSLGNFVFGGHNRVSRGEGTNSLYTMAVQARMYFDDNGVYTGQQIVLYPAYDSGADPVNNYQPVRVTAEEAVPIMAAVQYDTEWQLPALQTDEAGYAYVMMDFLPASAGQTEQGAPEAALPQLSRDQR